MNQIYFITGIDTGCGKTYATGLIARALRNEGTTVITQKLVQTGCAGISEDILEHRRLMGCDLFPEDRDGTTCPYVFSFPASPHLAARLDRIPVHMAAVTAATFNLSRNYDVVLIEGAGGLHVPLTERMLTIDYVKEQNYPVILVSSSKLGSINHTLLSIESCFNRNMNLRMVWYNQLPGDDKIIAADTFQVIRKALCNSYPNALLTGSTGENEALLELFKTNYIENKSKTK